MASCHSLPARRKDGKPAPLPNKLRANELTSPLSTSTTFNPDPSQFRTSPPSLHRAAGIDPSSITTACAGLLGAVGGTPAKIVTFIRGCRDAQADLASVLEELSQSQLVIKLLRDDDDINNNQAFAESLRSRVSDLLSNCLTILGNADTVLNKYTGAAGAAKWVMFGKDDIIVLRTALETHRRALSLMLDLLSISLSKRIKEDTAAVRGTVGVID
jgi:hypothetical protein